MSFGSQGPYYSNLQGGAGGFMPPSQGGTQATPGGEDRKQNNQSLRPVNIAQIYMAEQSHHSDVEYTVEGNPVTMITVVAQVMNLQHQTTSDVYKLDDGSGEIDARHWVDKKSDGDEMETDPDSSPVINHYVRVIGTIKTYQNRRHINATIVRVLDDPMEAFFHFNELMAVTMMMNKGLPQGGKGGAPMMGGTSASAASYSRGQAPTSGENDALYQGFGPVEKGIIKFLKESEAQPDGWHVRSIMRSVNAPIRAELQAGRGSNEAEVFANALDNLTTQGVLFSTLDEQHFTLV